MANFVYNKITARLPNAEIDWDGSDIRVLLVMTNTTADTEKNATTIGGFTTLDEMDGANYTTGGIALTTEAIVEDFGNNRTYLDADDATWNALGAGTRQVQAAIAYKFVTSLSLSYPIAFYDTGGFPFTASGANVTIQWNAFGMVQLTA